MNTSILFILVFGIPIFGYIFIGKILAKSFNNTPDAPSYLEKSPPSFFVRFLKSVLRIASVIAIAVVISHVQIGVFSDLMRFDNPEEQKIIDEYEELKENEKARFYDEEIVKVKNISLFENNGLIRLFKSYFQKEDKDEAKLRKKRRH